MLIIKCSYDKCSLKGIGTPVVFGKPFGQLLPTFIKILEEEVCLCISLDPLFEAT